MEQSLQEQKPEPVTFHGIPFNSIYFREPIINFVIPELNLLDQRSFEFSCKLFCGFVATYRKQTYTLARNTSPKMLIPSLTLSDAMVNQGALLKWAHAKGYGALTKSMYSLATWTSKGRLIEGLDGVDGEQHATLGLIIGEPIAKTVNATTFLKSRRTRYFTQAQWAIATYQFEEFVNYYKLIEKYDAYAVAQFFLAFACQKENSDVITCLFSDIERDYCVDQSLDGEKGLLFFQDMLAHGLDLDHLIAIAPQKKLEAEKCPVPLHRISQENRFTELLVKAKKARQDNAKPEKERASDAKKITKAQWEIKIRAACEAKDSEKVNELCFATDAEYALFKAMCNSSKGLKFIKLLVIRGLNLSLAVTATLQQGDLTIVKNILDIGKDYSRNLMEVSALRTKLAVAQQSLDAKDKISGGINFGRTYFKKAPSTKRSSTTGMEMPHNPLAQSGVSAPKKFGKP